MRKVFVLTLLAWAASAHAMEIPDAGTPEAKAFAARCSLCHALPHPKRLDWARWRAMLAVMQRRAKERGVEIPEADWRLIARYLQRHAR